MIEGESFKCAIIRAVDPASVVCPESILVNALLTLGVPLHPDPRFAYLETRETINGKVRRVLQWTLLDKSSDGFYETGKLIEWWRDPKWLAANPTHELAVIKVASENLMRLAERIRRTPHVAVFRKGKRLAMIPSQLPEAAQREWREKLEAAAA